MFKRCLVHTDSSSSVALHDDARMRGSRNIRQWGPGLEVIKLEFILKLKIKHNDWLLADTRPQAANHCALF